VLHGAQPTRSRFDGGLSSDDESSHFNSSVKVVLASARQDNAVQLSSISRSCVASTKNPRIKTSAKNALRERRTGGRRTSIEISKADQGLESYTRLKSVISSALCNVSSDQMAIAQTCDLSVLKCTRAMGWLIGRLRFMPKECLVQPSPESTPSVRGVKAEAALTCNGSYHAPYRVSQSCGTSKKRFLETCKPQNEKEKNRIKRSNKG
jgi:hypothetical protein